MNWLFYDIEEQKIQCIVNPGKLTYFFISWIHIVEIHYMNLVCNCMMNIIKADLCYHGNILGAGGTYDSGPINVCYK
jgi:hypothetical protein